jgi:hypothetical protein
MADAYTQVPADSTGDKIDTEELTVSAQTVNRQRVQIAGTADTDISPVSSTNGLLVNLGTNNDVTVDYSAAEDAALPSAFVLIAADDGTDTKPLQADATSGDLKVTLDSETVELAAGSASIGTLGANSGVDIGDVDVTTMPATAADAAAGLPSVLAVMGGYDGTNVRRVTTDAAGNVQVDIVAELPAGTQTIGKLGANTGVDIGDVDILSIAAGDNNIGNVDIVSQPADTFVAEDGALGKGVLIQGDDGTDRHNIAVDTAGNVQVDIIAEIPAGTQNIGDVDVATIAAGSNLIGSVSLDIDGSDGGTLQATKFASIDVASSGDNTIITAVAGKQFRILSYVIVASGGANTCQWKSAATNKSGGMGLAEFGGVSAESMWGVMQGGTNENFILNLSAATSVDGHIAYVEV